MPILLSDEEIERVSEKCTGFLRRDVAQAQLKKVVEWGEGDCPHIKKSIHWPKKQCALCWQALKKEAGL